MKMQTISEYVAIHGTKFFVYDERIDGYLFDEDTIDTNSKDWEVVKDEVIIEFDEASNELITLIIHTLEEETEEESYNGCLHFDSKEDYDSYCAHLARDERNFKD